MPGTAGVVQSQIEANRSEAREEVNPPEKPAERLSGFAHELALEPDHGTQGPLLCQLDVFQPRVIGVSPFIDDREPCADSVDGRTALDRRCLEREGLTLGTVKWAAPVSIASP